MEELSNKDKENLNKIIKYNIDWVHKNETLKTNSILAILTFFIAFGEISMVSINISKQLSINYFWIFIPLTTISTMLILFILKHYATKKNNHSKKITEYTGWITSGKGGNFFGI